MGNFPPLRLSVGTVTERLSQKNGHILDNHTLSIHIHSFSTLPALLIMSQSRIRSFFSAAGDDAYAAQLQRDRDEHSAAREQERYREAVLRARHCVEREAGEKRGVGRPRKRPVALISINNSGSGSVHIGNITVSMDSASPIDDLPAASTSIATDSATATASATATTSAPASTASIALTLAYSAKRPRTNWFASPQLAAQILAAVKLHQSFQGAVTALQRDEKTAGVFDTLNESTVRQWYHSRSFTLTPHSEQRLAGHTAPRSGRPPLLTQYPDVEQYVVDAITSIRSAGGVINSIVISAFFRGMVRAKHPELFTRFRFGRRWCRWWFGRTFDWTYKRGSTSGQKLPADWEEQCAAMVKRVSASAAEHKIKHPCFIINWDQTGCVLVPAGKYTYASVKSKQVPIVGKDEKRQITAVVASTLEGEMLPLQLIFAGQDKNKQEQKAVPTLNEVTTKRVRDWHLTQTHNHWSSLESMKDYIRVIIKKWVDNKARQHNVVLPHVILLIDCWSVHTSAAFRDWIKVAHPNYHLLFVPANCTSKAQPADAGLQRPFKNAITNSFNAWMADEIHHTVMGGTAAAEVRVDLGLKRLKPQMVHWAWVAWDRLKRSPDVVRDSWNKCGLSSVLIAEQQVDAMRFCMSNKEDEPGVEPDLELERTDSDGEDEAEDGVSDEWIEGE